MSGSTCRSTRSRTEQTYTPDARAADFAAARDGVASIAQLAACGLDHDAIGSPRAPRVAAPHPPRRVRRRAPRDLAARTVPSRRPRRQARHGARALLRSRRLGLHRLEGARAGDHRHARRRPPHPRGQGLPLGHARPARRAPPRRHPGDLAGTDAARPRDGAAGEGAAQGGASGAGDAARDAREIVEICDRFAPPRGGEAPQVVADGPAPTASPLEDIVLDLLDGAGIPRPLINRH